MRDEKPIETKDENAHTITDEFDEPEESVTETTKSKGNRKDRSSESSTNQITEQNSPYSKTHNEIFEDSNVNRLTEHNLENFNLDDLLAQMKVHFYEYLFTATNAEKTREPNYKPYDKIIEELFATIEKCKEAYSRSANLYKDDTNCLAYKKTICECIQDWDSAIVEAFNEGISKVNGSQDKGSYSNKCYEKARALMAHLENVIQADAYAGFYIESVKAIFGEKIDEDDDDNDDDNAWSSNKKLFKGDGKKYPINICYVAAARTIGNFIEVIQFILGQDQGVCEKISALSDSCQSCINLNTPLQTSITEFTRMPDKIQDIKNSKNKVFGNSVRKVNDEAFSESLSKLSELIKGLNEAETENELSIGTDLEKIHSFFCKIPSNTADCKFQNLQNIMTGIFTEDGYDSHNKMFRPS